MSLIAFEENGVLPLRRNFVDLTVIAGGNVEITGLIESEIPDVFGAGRKIDGGIPGGIQSGLARIFRGIVGRLARLAPGFVAGLVLELVNLTVRSSGGIDYTAGANFQRLHLEFLRFENDRGFSIWSDAIDTRGRASRSIYVAGIVSSDRPNVGRRRRVEQLEGGRQFKTTSAADRHSSRRPLHQVFEHHSLFLRPDESPAGDLAVPLLQELRRVVLVHRMRTLSMLLSVTVVRDPEGLAALEDSAHAGHGLPRTWCSCRVAHRSSFL